MVLPWGSDADQEDLELGEVQHGMSKTSLQTPDIPGKDLYVLLLVALAERFCRGYSTREFVA